jgi:hypothetical protein
MIERKQVNCPHCGHCCLFERSATGRWVGAVAGGGLGWFLAGGLGLAGTIIGFPVAVAAAGVGLAVGVVTGNRIGKAFDDSQATCPHCRQSMVL